MNFLELRKRLAEMIPSADRPSARPENVFFLKYDRAKGMRWDGVWNIREEGQKFRVGFVDRGQFFLEAEFDHEEDACEWLYSYLTTPQNPAARITREEWAASVERMQTRIAAEEAEHHARRDDDA